jgi:Na+-translocating ferredoxin:NAD+ oxidoreductase subunit D
VTKKEKSSTNLIFSTSPHVRDRQSVRKIMWFVVLALLPANIYSIYLFGINILILLAVSVASAVVSESLYQFFIKKPVTVSDGSAVITGLLIAMNVPTGLPVWMAAVGCFFAIIIVKQAFGGLGFNIFNPALSGIAFMIALWPTEMVINYEYGEISLILLLVGAFFLIFKKIISWHIPFSFIGTVCIFMLSYYNIAGYGFSLSILMSHLFSVSLFLGAVFMATDMVTSPITKKGMVIFGIGCGVLSSVIQLWGAYFEGVCYAILFMNAAVPLIDRYSKPRVFGT